MPGPGEKPQTFETVEKIERARRVERIAAQTTEPQLLSLRHLELFVAGTSPRFKPGDVILIVGDEATETNAASEETAGMRAS